MYIDYAEFQAARGKLMTMQNWSEKLDAFLKFNEQDILKNFGSVSHEVAKSLAEKEYEKYRVMQDAVYKSDFDKVLEMSRSITKKENEST